MVNQQLVDYIRRTKLQGYTPQQIYSYLIQLGYNQQTVNEAINHVIQNPTIKAPKGSHKKFLFIVIALVLIMGASAATLITMVMRTCGNGVVDSGETLSTCCIDVGCLGEQTCEENTCINPICGACQYLEEYECKDYDCCDDSECLDTKECFNHKCEELNCGYCQYPSEHECNEYVCCDDVKCDDSNNNTIDKCVNPITGNAMCSYEKIGACSSNEECDDSNLCTIDGCSQSTENCMYTPVTICFSGDGCCPAECNNTNDGDCLQPCETNADCDDLINCTEDICVATKTCTHKNITKCGEEDGCCLSGCDYWDGDDDCPPFDACNATDDCDDNDACTLQNCTGDPKECLYADVTSCIMGDSCCPSSCNHLTDDDCSEEDHCNSNSDCNDADTCTLDVCSGSPKNCSNTDITTCSSGDGCCPSLCEYINDTDCPQLDLCSLDSECDDGIDCTLDVCSGSPKNCSNTNITLCNDDDGCCPYGCSPLDDVDCPLGECIENIDCDDLNPCTDDVCVDAISDYCTNDPIPDCGDECGRNIIVDDSIYVDSDYCPVMGYEWANWLEDEVYGVYWQNANLSTAASSSVIVVPCEVIEYAEQEVDDNPSKVLDDEIIKQMSFETRELIDNLVGDGYSIISTQLVSSQLIHYPVNQSAYKNYYLVDTDSNVSVDQLRNDLLEATGSQGSDIGGLPVIGGFVVDDLFVLKQQLRLYGDEVLITNVITTKEEYDNRSEVAIYVSDLQSCFTVE